MTTEPILAREGVSPEPQTYQIGALHYDLKGLYKLFGWLLWGDFAFVFFEGIFGSFIPLYASQLHASNALIGIMMGSVAGALNLLFGPGVSRWSDNLRSRWGRRIPFIAAMTPFIVVTVILMGYAPEVGGFLYRGGIHQWAPTIELNTVVLALLTFVAILFHFANMVLINAYTWLQRDVIPQEVMARFLSWIRVVSIASGALFSWFVFPHIIDERKIVCVSIGAFYMVVFLVMCWKVKEGDYPAPIIKKENVAMFYLGYFRQCFTVRIYRYYFLRCLIGGVTACAGTFQIFFVLKTLGVSMEFLGKFNALTTIASALLLIPAGWLCDRFTPYRVLLIGGVIGLVMTALSFFFNVNTHTFVIFGIINLPLGVAVGLCASAMTMEIFPSEKFAQLSTAGNIFIMGIMTVGNPLVGFFMDAIHNNYRMLLVWSFFWDSLSLSLLWLLYREWQRLGGRESYVPPVPPE